MTADYVHAGIFIPIIGPNADDEGFTFNPLSNVATKLAYWDKEAWASELVVSPDNPEEASKDDQAFGGSGEPSAIGDKESKIKKRKGETKEGSKQKKVRNETI